MQRISRFTLIDVDEFARKINGFKPYTYVMKKNSSKKCFFLKLNSCLIYPIRPLICKFYPFQLNFTDNTYVFTFTTECQGVGKGDILKKIFFKRLFKVFKTSLGKNKFK